MLKYVLYYFFVKNSGIVNTMFKIHKLYAIHLIVIITYYILKTDKGIRNCITVYSPPSSNELDAWKNNELYNLS